MYDKKMGTYLKPVAVTHLIEMQRSISSVLKEPSTLIAQYPSDFELFLLGEFDEQTGEIKLQPKPHFVLNIQELMPETKEPPQPNLPLSFDQRVRNSEKENGNVKKSN